MKTTFVSLVLFAAAAAAHAVDVSATLTTTVDLKSSIFGFSSPSDPFPGAAKLPALIPAGTYSTSASIDNATLSQFLTYSYTTLSVYGSGDSKGVVIALNSTGTLAALGKPFETVFGSSISEASLVTAIEGAYADNLSIFSAHTQKLATFYNAHRSLFPTGTDVTSSLIGFSDGHSVGSLVVTPVPEPASMVALGAGAMALLRRRRRS